MTDHDKDLDDLIRTASGRETDDSATFRAVLRKIDTAEARPPLRLPSFGPNIAAAGFAAMMFMAGFVGYTLPDLTLGDPDEDMLLLALGDTGPTAGSLLAILEHGE